MDTVHLVWVISRWPHAVLRATTRYEHAKVVCQFGLALWNCEWTIVQILRDIVLYTRFHLTSRKVSVELHACSNMPGVTSHVKSWRYTDSQRSCTASCGLRSTARGTSSIKSCMINSISNWSELEAYRDVTYNVFVILCSTMHKPTST